MLHEDEVMNMEEGEMENDEEVSADEEETEDEE